MTRRPVQFGLGDLDRWPELTSPVEALDPPPGATLPPRAVRTFLHGGGIFVSAVPAVAVTILGSCVSVCLWDPARQVGGMNHYLLPWESTGDQSPQRHGPSAIPALVDQITALGIRRGALQAKVFGGSCGPEFASSATPLGSRNVATARAVLQDLGIPVVAEDVGGTQGRKVFFHTGDGTAWVRKL